VVEQKREYEVQGGVGPAAQVRLITKYEAGDNGHWITFAPDFDSRQLRDIANPHQNGKIPVRLKYAYPLLDSIYGLGDMERGKTLQFAIDSLINLYLDGVKMSIFPPLIVKQEGVVASSIKYKPGARWLETSTEDAIRSFQTSPQGLQTFQSTYQFLKAALLNQNGSTDTSITVANSGDPQFGKTPAALALQGQRESSRDNWDRFQMEKFIEGLYEEMINLLATNKEEWSAEVALFETEVQQIKSQGLEDVAEIYESGKAGRLSLTSKGKKGIGGVKYKYLVDASSTMQKDQATEHQALSDLLTVIIKAPQILQVAQQQGKSVDVGELFKRYIISSGISDWEKIITEVKEADANNQTAGAMPGVADASGQGTGPAGAAALARRKADRNASNQVHRSTGQRSSRRLTASRTALKRPDTLD
jgi:hypothetical protein